MQPLRGKHYHIILFCIDCAMHKYILYNDENEKRMMIFFYRYAEESRRNFEATLDWLHEHACSRSYGLGKKYC